MKVMLLAVGALIGIAGVLGLSKTALAIKISELSRGTIAIGPKSASEMCTPEAMANDPVLFISCGGFME